MEKLVSLCNRRGFIFQAGELYGGLNGCWDYGPLGAELTVIPASVEAAVELAGLEDEAAAFAQGNDFLHSGGIGDVFVGHGNVGWGADGSRRGSPGQGAIAARESITPPPADSGF
jgi:hypothetical protein